MATDAGQSLPQMRGPSKVMVSVTAELIERALPRDSGHCMIADAIKATIPTAKAVTVDLASIRWTDPRAGKRYLYLTPPSVQEALLRFDNGIKPPPFRFGLRHPAQIVTSGDEKNKRGGRVTKGLAELTNASPTAVPTKVGGTLPNGGPLTNPAKTSERRNSGQDSSHIPDQANHLLGGRRRAFGLKKMGRPKIEIESAEQRARIAEWEQSLQP
jgi:hypothetical protein